MKLRKVLAGLVFGAVSMMALTACQKNQPVETETETETETVIETEIETEAESWIPAGTDLKEGVTCGRTVFFAEDGKIYFAAKKSLFSGILASDEEAAEIAETEVVIETEAEAEAETELSPLEELALDVLTANLPEKKDSVVNLKKVADSENNIYYIAVYKDQMYMSTSKNLVSIPIVDGYVDLTAAKELYNKILTEGFEIYDDYLYYSKDDVVYRQSLEEGIALEVAKGVQDWDITCEGLLYTDTEGGLYWDLLDGSNRKHLTDTPANTSFTVNGSDIYYKGTEDKQLCCYHLDLGKADVLDTEEEVNSQEVIWVTDNYVTYYTPLLSIFRKSLSDGSEMELKRIGDLPYKDNGVLVGEKLYESFYDCLYVYDLEANKRERISLSEVMEQEPVQPRVESTEDRYYILDGANLQKTDENHILDTVHFSLYMPIEPEWQYVAVNDCAFKIYYPAALETDQEGTLVTIMAFDLDDTAYEAFPSYTIAGISKDKCYVAVFPTDVQFITADKQEREEFSILQEYVEQINNENEKTDNPFMVY